MSRSNNPNMTVYYSLKKITMDLSMLIFWVCLNRKSRRKMMMERQCGSTIFRISKTVA